MTHHKFCSNSCELKASVISRYTNYLLGKSILMMLGWIVRSTIIGMCLEGVGGGCNLPGHIQV